LPPLSPQGTFNLAMCYRHGTGVAKDIPRCIELLSKAAKEGSKASQFHLGLLLEKGEIGIIDKDA
jgi:TPR repeat protein